MSTSEQLNDPRSPVRKKIKQQNRARRTYFFQPQNTLAYRPNIATNNVLESPTKPKEGSNTIVNEAVTNSSNEEPNVNLSLQTIPASINCDEPHKRVSFTKAMDRSTDQQSSDDSFDGVRWKSDRKASTFVRPILSSPLKKAEIIDSVAQVEESILTEVTDSMLTKYGVGTKDSLSQTPRLARTCSEVPKNTVDVSPSLHRSKSFDPKSLREKSSESLSEERLLIFNGLNKWIDQFDDTPVTTAPEPKSQLLEVPRVSSLAKEVVNSVSDNDNLSSDDDSFLATLRVDSFTPALQVDAPVPQKNPTPVPVPAPDSLITEFSDDGDDPFSDDLDILALNNLATQPSTINSTTSSKLKIEEFSKGSEATKSFFEEKEYGPEISYSRPDFERYQINSIVHSSYQHQSFKRNQLILGVTDSNKVETKLLVRGEASDLRLQINDIIHVIHTFADNHKLIDDTHNLLICNPDILVPSTVCADQLFCPRKTVLNKRFSFPGSVSVPLLLGTIVHEIFQICMISEEFSLDYMEKLLDIEIQKRLIEIYSVGDVIEELRVKARAQFSVLRRWFLRYFKQRPVEIPTNNRQQSVKFSVAEILDVEESVWSPMFGIKGIADVTIKANLDGENGISQYLLPMEIKTGQPHFSHQAQAALYSLLFKDRYNIDISSFLLVYSLDEGSTTKHSISVSDLRSLVNLRNRISFYLKPGNQDLPDLLRQQICERCDKQQSCMTLNYMLEDGTSEDSGLNGGHYDVLTEHLQGRSDYQHFLSLWDDLLSKEEEFMSRVNKELWVMTAKDREKQRGKALGDLVISKCIEDKHDANTYLYTFKRNKSRSLELMNTTQISKYDKIIVSDEAGHFALAQGFVTHIDEHSITVSTRRRIVPTQSKSDVFHRAKVLLPSQRSIIDGEAVVFRIDKDEIFYGMGVARYNVLNLFLENGDAKRREMIVDLRAPKFTSSPQFLISADNECFNDGQLAAFKRISCATDYCLILGMPGTGKTTVVSHLIKMLVDAKKSVLLTSYTNSAVDNILLKVADLGVDFLRVGNVNRIHPEVREYVIGSKKKPLKSLKDFEKHIMNPFVVAGTCLSIKDVTFNIRDHFDYCIVDEASQVSMPINLGPLAFCDKFVLVGDHFQLPPLVTHPSLEVRRGLSRSLFQHLATEHPGSVVELNHQYRMCEDIMAISNELVYENRLICGSEAVANQRLILPNPEGYKANCDDSLDHSWLQRALNENSSVVFFNHDTIPAYEKTTGENIVNIAEVALVKQTVEAFCACGIEPSSIGVMTLYKSQLKLLLDTFRHIPALEILTADRFQGRDKECIVISMVRSNIQGRAGELMKDWRRINVAVTRARSKLIVFGSESTLLTAESSRGFVALSAKNGWTFNLKKNSVNWLGITDKPANEHSKLRTGKVSPKVLEKNPVLSNILDDMN